MNRPWILSCLSAAALLISNTPVACGQGIFQEFGRQIERSVEKSVDRFIQPNQQPAKGKQNPSKAAPSSIPSESGSFNLPNESANNNLPGGRFGNGNAYIIQPEYSQPVRPARTYPGTQNPPVYVERTYRSSGSNQATGIPGPPIDAENNPYISIRCSKSSIGSCRYTLRSSLGEYAFTISGGQEQRFRETTDWVIRYDEAGISRSYRVRAGLNYRFKQDEQDTWRLYVLP